MPDLFSAKDFEEKEEFTATDFEEGFGVGEFAPTRTEQVEEKISQRKDILKGFLPFAKEELTTSSPGSPRELGIPLRALGGGLQRAEAAVAAPILQFVRGAKEKGLAKQLFTEPLDIPGLAKESVRGLRGERLVERGDIFRELGFPEFAAATLGLVTDPLIIKSFFQKGATRVTTRVAQQGDDLIDDVMNRAVKPSIAKRKSFGQLQKAKAKTNEAVRTIVENKQNLEFVDDATGEVVNRLPQNLDEFSQAINQTQQKLWDDAIAPALEASKKKGLLIDGNEIAGALDDVIKSKSLKFSNPKIIEKARELQNLFLDEKIDPVTAQKVLTDFNRELTRFFSTPGATFTETTEAALKAQLARKTREILAREVSKITGKEFGILKSKYGALSSIEQDVIKAVVRNAKKGKGIINTFADILATGNISRGLVSLGTKAAKPELIAAGIGQRLAAGVARKLGDPNRLVANMFKQVDVLNTPGKFELLKQFGIGGAKRATGQTGIIGLKEAQKEEL